MESVTTLVPETVTISHVDDDTRILSYSELLNEEIVQTVVNVLETILQSTKDVIDSSRHLSIGVSVIETIMNNSSMCL